MTNVSYNCPIDECIGFILTICLIKMVHWYQVESLRCLVATVVAGRLVLVPVFGWSSGIFAENQFTLITDHIPATVQQIIWGLMRVMATMMKARARARLSNIPVLSQR